jgi:HSP20 family molecular chaperone IbpA
MEVTKEIEPRKETEKTSPRKIYTPPVDIIERDEDVLLIADMPGVDENSVEVTLEKDILSIYGKVNTEIPEGYKPVISEYEISDYKRVFALSDEIDRENIQATVKNGVLKLTLPKVEAVKTRKIPVIAEA